MNMLSSYLAVSTSQLLQSFKTEQMIKKKKKTVLLYVCFVLKRSLIAHKKNTSCHGLIPPVLINVENIGMMKCRCCFHLCSFSFQRFIPWSTFWKGKKKITEQALVHLYAFYFVLKSHVSFFGLTYVISNKTKTNGCTAKHSKLIWLKKRINLKFYFYYVDSLS